MPKILRIINRLNLGGPTYNVAYLSKYLEPEYETLLLSGMKDDSEASSEFIVNKLGIKPLYLKTMRREISLLDDYKAYQEIKRIIKEFQPDIVHTHASKAGALGRLAAYSSKVPVIVHTFHGHTFHSYFGKIKTRFFLTIERFLAKRTTKIIAISALQKADLTEQYNICEKDKISVVPLGFDLNRFKESKLSNREKFRTQYHIDQGEIAIGIVGRLVPIKNHELFLNAINEVARGSNKKVKFFIIGDGELKGELLKKADELGISYSLSNDPEKILYFTSWIERIEVAYAGLDIVALTSFNEGTPVSLIEAQASGKPVVSTNVGGVNDIIKDGESGILVNDFTVSCFSNALLRLCDDEMLREKMSGNGNHVYDSHSYTVLVNNVGKLYKELLNS